MFWKCMCRPNTNQHKPVQYCPDQKYSVSTWLYHYKALCLESTQKDYSDHGRKRNWAHTPMGPEYLKWLLPKAFTSHTHGSRIPKMVITKGFYITHPRVQNTENCCYQRLLHHVRNSNEQFKVRSKQTIILSLTTVGRGIRFHIPNTNWRNGIKENRKTIPDFFFLLANKRRCNPF